MAIPRTLYKYRPFNTNTLRIIERHNIYYADPSDFNDPLDCDPTIGSFKSIKTAEAVIEDFYNGLNVNISGLERIQQLREEFHSGPESITNRKRKSNSLLSIYSDEISRLVKIHFSTVGVFSLSEESKNVLMWSHYADEHKGICIGFRTSDSISDHLKPVEYDQPRTIPFKAIVGWRINGSVSDAEIVSKLYFYSKAPAWGYEKEWRDLSFKKSGRVTGHGGQTSPFSISEIIFGLKCDFSVIATCIRIHESRLDAIDFYKIETTGNTFKLKRRKITPEEWLSSSPGMSIADAMGYFRDHE